MAQVKKLQNGGSPSNKYLMFNGTKIVEGDDNFKQLEQQALNGNRAAQSMLKTLRSNSYDNSMIVNTTDNGVDFQNVDMGYYNDRTGKQFERGDNWWRRNVSRTKEGKDYIKDFIELKFGTPDDKKEEKDTNLGVLSHGNDASFIYHDQEDGTKLYSTGPQNMQNEKIIRDIFSNLGSTREDLEKKYNFDNWGENFWTLQNWYNVNRDYDVNALIDRIKKGVASDADLELLQLMRFNVGRTKNKPGSTEITGLEFDDSFLNGITNQDPIKQAAARRGVGIKKGDDGNWYVTGNTDFINGTWYAGDLDFLEGTPYAEGAIHNGRLFTKQQVLSGDPGIAQYISPFISAWRNASDYRSGYDAANNSNVRFVGDRLWNNASNDHYGPFNVQFDPTKQYHRVWSDYFDNIDSEYPWNITDVTGAYDGLDGRQIIAYIDPSEQNKRDIGMFGADWVVYDPNNVGNPYQVFDNEISMRNALGLTQTSDPYGYSNDFTTSTWTNIGDQAYAMRDVIKTKGDQENTILVGEDGFLYLARKNQSGGFESPKRITNLELLNKVLQNPKDYDNTTIDQLTAPVNNNVTPETMLDNADYMLHTLGKFHHGGVLKLAYGNTVYAANTTSSTKNTEDAKTDITKDHLLNGEDGGLSQAEKMQIGAAIGDLAGVGISFMGPVGNIAGAVTGLGATATRFAADVKQDGFQAKDAWNAAIGAALDFASVIPFIGAGAKTAKALKVIKSAANPIMKVLSLYGAVNGAAAMSKVISGEKVTSEDLQAIIGGLSSSLIAGKQFKDMLGDSKLASMLSKRVADSANASKSIVPKAKIGDTEIELDVTKINDKPKSEAEVIKYIKETAKTKLGRELTDAESKGLLEQFGLKVAKGEKAGMRWKNLLKFKNPVVRKSGKVEFETPEDISGNGTLYYMLNPFARQKALGMGWHGFAHNKGLLSEISENDIKDAQIRIKNNEGSLKDYALMRQTIDNPTAFGDIFEGTSYRLSKFGYPAYARSLKSSSNNNAKRQNVLNNETVKTSNSIVPSKKLLSTSTTNTALIPINKINASAGDVTFRRSPITETMQNVRTVNDIRPLQQRPSKWRRLNAPQQQSDVEIVIGPDGIARIGNRSQRFLNESQDLFNLYSKYKQYQQALNNVNSEKAFKKLLDNMKNDVTLKLMLEDQPGLLRNEFTSARQRAGLSKKSMGDIDLMFKQGGVIKAQNGISALYSWTPKATNTWTPKGGYTPTKLKLNTSVVPESKTAFKHTPSEQLVSDFKTKSDAIVNNSAQKLSTIGIIPKTTNGGLDSGNGTIGKNINWNSIASNALEAGNFVRAWNEGNRIKRIYNKKAQALTNTQMYHMPEVGLRFQNPIHSQYDKQIADLYQRTGMQAGNTSDAKLQAAIFSDANNLAMNHRAQQNLAMSDAWTNYQNQNLQNKQRYDQINWEIDAQNKQKQYAATDLRLTGEADVNTQRSQLLDKAFNKAQYLVDKDRKVNAAMAEFMLKYPNATLDQQDQYKTYVQAQYAKKGGKLRPITEQMLLNNQKIIAKAIEKMNDNTMKLILKALS